MKQRNTVLLSLLIFMVILGMSCASTNIRNLNYKLFQVSTRIYDLETRGIRTDEFSQEVERCEDLLDSEQYSEAAARINQLVDEVNEYYQSHQAAFTIEYEFEDVRFQDVYVDISTGRRVGFMTSPLAEGKYPGIIFLRGAAGSSIDLKKAIHFYARKGYVCLSPEFNSESYLNGTFDLKKWYEIFTQHSYLDPERIGVVSYSRGSAFAYKLIEHNVPLKAWVNFWGLVFPSLVSLETIEKNPVPVFIFHGKKDDECPVEWVYNLERIYKEAGVPHKVKIFPDEGHGFSRKAMDEVRGMMIDFLEKHLKEDSIFHL